MDAKSSDIGLTSLTAGSSISTAMSEEGKDHEGNKQGAKAIPSLLLGLGNQTCNMRIGQSRHCV